MPSIKREPASSSSSESEKSPAPHKKKQSRQKSPVPSLSRARPRSPSYRERRRSRDRDRSRSRSRDRSRLDRRDSRRSPRDRRVSPRHERKSVDANRMRRDDGKSYGLSEVAKKSQNNDARERIIASSNRQRDEENEAATRLRPRPDDGKWGKDDVSKPDSPPIEKEKPNFVPSGKLLEDTNMFNGVVVKYNEPSDARKPKMRWRLYPFKGEEALPVLYVHRQSAFLIGRDRRVADLAVDHPSCSKQHAALQFRSIPYEKADGSKSRRIVPYIIDLASANGTFLNNERIPEQRYVELKEKDVLKFGFSTREFVLLNEKSSEREEEEDAIGEDLEDN